MKTIHHIFWPAKKNHLKKDLSFTIEVQGAVVDKVDHGVAGWGVNQPWHRVCSWLMNKGAEIESFEQGPHATYEQFKKEFEEHIVGYENEQYIKDAYIFYIGQPNMKRVDFWLMSFTKGTKRGMDKIYYVHAK